MKKLFIIMGSLIGLGLIVIFIAFAASGFKLEIFDNDATLVESSHAVSSNTNLELKVSTSEVNITKSNDDKIYLSYYNTEKRKITVTDENDLISLKRDDAIIQWYQWFSFTTSKKINTINIKVPENFVGNISLLLSTGDVEIIGLSKFNNLNISITTGEVDLLGLDLNDLEISGTTGSIEVENTNLSKLDIENSTGDVTLDNVTVQSSINIRNTTGEIDLETVKADSVRAESSTGGIDFENLKAKSIYFKTTTGNIEGSFVERKTEFSITSSTTTGRNTLPASWVLDTATTVLHAQTTTGNIKVYFSD